MLFYKMSQFPKESSHTKVIIFDPTIKTIQTLASQTNIKAQFCMEY